MSRFDPELVEKVADRLAELRDAKIGYENAAEGYGVYFYGKRSDAVPDGPLILKRTGFQTVDAAGRGVYTEMAEAVLQLLEREGYAGPQHTLAPPIANLCKVTGHDFGPWYLGAYGVVRMCRRAACRGFEVRPEG